MFQGPVVTFSCVGDTSVDDLVWQTEGPAHYINIATYRESELIVSSLLMTAHPGYNLTTVSCTALCGSELCGKSMARLIIKCKSNYVVVLYEKRSYAQEDNANFSCMRFSCTLILPVLLMDHRSMVWKSSRALAVAKGSLVCDDNHASKGF